MAVLALLGLMFHWFELPGAAARVAARSLGGAALLVAPLLPLFALVSPAPVNGAKLLVFPAAVTIALVPWVPREWLGEEARSATLARLFVIAILANLVVLGLPGSGGPPPREKPVRWGSGGKLMAFVAAVALAAAALEVWRSRESQGTVAYRFASVALLVIFGFFLQTRFTSSPTATLVALALGIPAAAYFRARLALPNYQGLAAVADQCWAGIALALGTLYAVAHAARGESWTWAVIATLLSLGSARAFPPVSVGLVPALGLLALGALGRGRVVAFLLCLLAILPAAVTAANHFPPILRMLVGAETRVAAEPQSHLFSELAIVVGLLGCARVRFTPSATALFLFCLGLEGAALRWDAAAPTLEAGAVFGSALLAGALVSGSSETIPAPSATPTIA
jgi:hypothetical protein